MEMRSLSLSLSRPLTACLSLSLQTSKRGYASNVFLRSWSAAKSYKWSEEREGRREGEREEEEEIEQNAEKAGGCRGLRDEENEKMKGMTMKKGTRDRGNTKKNGDKA